MPSNSILRSVLLIALIGFCASCAFNRLPSSDERSKILTGQRVIVLLRVTAELQDGTPVKAFPSKLMADDVNIALGTFDTGGELKLVESPRFLSTELRKDGWTYFILEAATYYLGTIGSQTTDRFTWERQIKHAQRWRIDIPVDTHMVYIGTLHLTCSSRWYIFEEERCDWIDESRSVIRNEMLMAQKLAVEYFGEYGAPQTLLMHRQDAGTIILRTPKRK